MECTTQEHDKYVIIALSGDVDMQYSPTARSHILKSLGDRKNVLVDMSGVSYIDSSGIASLVEGLQLARSSQLEFGLVGVSDAALQVLQLARLDRVFKIKPTIDDFIEK